MVKLEELSTDGRRVLVKHLNNFEQSISIRIKCNAIGAINKVTLSGSNSVLFGQGCKVSRHLVNNLIRKESKSHSNRGL